MNIKQIQAFKMVVLKKSFNRAAVSLITSPSSIMRMIDNLENELQVSLFNREFNGCTLTKQGELFVEYADKFDFLFEEMNFALISSFEEKRTINIGIDHSLNQFFVFNIYKDFNNPNFSLNFINISYENFFESLLKKNIDLCFALKPMNFSKKLNYCEIIEKKACISVLSNSPLAEFKEVSADNLKEYTICIAPLQNSIDVIKAKKRFGTEKIFPCTYFEFISINRKDYVYLTSGFVSFDNSRFKIINITDITGSYGILFRAEDKKMLQPFIEKAVEYFKGI